MKVLCIYREARFSPSSVKADKTILDAVVRQLSDRGDAVKVVRAEDAGMAEMLRDADAVFSMARDRVVQDMLEQAEAMGCKVVNRPSGVRACGDRGQLEKVMRQVGAPVPSSGGYPCWVKRNDGWAESQYDVVYCRDEASADIAIGQMIARGIDKIIVQQHIKGDLVKCYGVAGTDVFKTSYPAENGRSKFGLETINDRPNHYAFDLCRMRTTFDNIANALGVTAYGGDAIVREDGSFVIIDFNDWPTFSTCVEAAAEAIASKMR